MARETRLIGAHRPSSVLLVRSNCHQARIGWELALASPLLKRRTVFGHRLVSMVVVAVTMTGSLNHGNEP